MKSHSLWNSLLLVGMLACARPSAGQLANSPWPKWQRDLRNSGYAPAVGPAEPRLKWKLECSAGFQQGIAIGPDAELYTGLAFFGNPPPGMVGGDYYGFYLTRISSAGQVEWKFALHDFYSSIPTLAALDRVYVVDGDPNFHISQTNLYALTRRGGFVWESRDDPPFSDRYGWNYMTVGNDGTIFYLDGPYALALDASDASVKWMRSVGYSSGQCPSLGADGTVYVTHSSGRTMSVELLALDPQDGSIRWSVSGPRDGGATGTSLASDGMIYTTFITTNEAILMAVWPDGGIRWQIPLAARPAFPPSIDAHGRLFLKTGSPGIGGFLESYDPDGTLRWQVDSTEGSTIPTVIDGRNQLYFVGPRTSETIGLWSYSDAGELRWSFDLGNPGSMWQAPAIGPDGTIYVAADETDPFDDIEHIYAIGPGEAPDPAWRGRTGP